jgi:hypothetical protein
MLVSTWLSLSFSTMLWQNIREISETHAPIPESEIAARRKPNK